MGLITKKVAGLPVDGTDEVKQTNEIGMAIPLLEGMDITAKTITADALLTQREDIRLFFERRHEPDFREPLTLEHGRLESRAIWTTTQLTQRLSGVSLRRPGLRH